MIYRLIRRKLHAAKQNVKGILVHSEMKTPHFAALLYLLVLCFHRYSFTDFKPFLFLLQYHFTSKLLIIVVAEDQVQKISKRNTILCNMIQNKFLYFFIFAPPLSLQ